MSESKIFGYANRMRAEPTAAELRFFQRLAGTPYKAYPQVVIRRRYIADFLFPAKAIIVEVDGKIHDEDWKMLADAERTEFLTHLGFRVIRVKNADVGLFDFSLLDHLPDAKPESLRQAEIAIKRTFGRTEGFTPFNAKVTGKMPVARVTGSPKKARIYAAYVPHGESKVFVGKPREPARYVKGKSGAFYKRFTTEIEAREWLQSKQPKPAKEKVIGPPTMNFNSSKWNDRNRKFADRASKGQIITGWDN